VFPAPPPSSIAFLHRAEVVQITGKSCRLEKTREVQTIPKYQPGRLLMINGSNGTIEEINLLIRCQLKVGGWCRLKCKFTGVGVWRCVTAEIGNVAIYKDVLASGVIRAGKWLVILRSSGNEVDSSIAPVWSDIC
jgi:hypothetical protein